MRSVQLCKSASHKSQAVRQQQFSCMDKSKHQKIWPRHHRLLASRPYRATLPLKCIPLPCAAALTVANPARGQLNSGKMKIFLSAFAPENLVSRDGFGSPAPHQRAHLHTQAESGAYLRDSSRVPRRRPILFELYYTIPGTVVLLTVVLK